MIDWEKKADELWLASVWIDAHARPEDHWEILVDGERIYLLSMRASETGGTARLHEMTLTEFKSISIELRSGIVGHVCIVLPQDAHQSGGVGLLIWLNKMGWTKFHVTANEVKESTLEAIEEFRGRAT